MPDSVDRYPLDPLDGPAAHKDALREIDRRISELEGQRFVASQFTTLDPTGLVRVVSGLLSDGTYGMEIDGGKVRALDIDLQQQQTNNAVTLTPTTQTVASTFFTPPLWAQTALLFGWCSFQITDQQGGPALLFGRVRIDTSAGTFINQGSVNAGQTIALSALHAVELSAPLNNPITVEGEAGIAAGSNSANRFALTALAIYTR